MMSDTDNQSLHPVTGVDVSNTTCGNYSPIVIGNNNIININPTQEMMQDTHRMAALIAERDALAAEVERLHRLLQQLLPPRES